MADVMIVGIAGGTGSGKTTITGQISERLGDEVTVKRLHRQGKVLQLLPENPDSSPISVSAADECAIEGIAVGLIRSTPLH